MSADPSACPPDSALLGFSTHEQTAFATAVSEVARNAFRYAGSGRVEFAIDPDQQPQLLSVRVQDKGPGIANVADILNGRYLPSMHHAKVMVVDGAWSVVGTTNFDNRSFGLNDEVNLATCGPALARLDEDFTRDLSRSHRVSYAEWGERPWTKRVVEKLGFFLRRHT